MANCKHIDTQPRVIAVDLSSAVAGTFERALHRLRDHDVELSRGVEPEPYGRRTSGPWLVSAIRTRSPPSHIAASSACSRIGALVASVARSTGVRTAGQRISAQARGRRQPLGGGLGGLVPSNAAFCCKGTNGNSCERGTQCRDYTAATCTESSAFVSSNGSLGGAAIRMLSAAVRGW